MEDGGVQRQRFEHRGFQLSYLDSAPDQPDRPVVLLLHGFPDEAAMWLPVIERLHGAGYRCLAPDTLGCGASQLGTRTRDYHARLIADDHAALLAALNIRQADVVGHDWGAALAWLIAGHHPDRVRRLVPISVGHPTAYARAEFRQKQIGWYTLFFQLPGLSERLLLGEGRFSLRRVFASHPDMDTVMQRMRAEPARLTAAVSIYRASLFDVLFRTQPPVSCDTLGIYSTGDRFLVASQMRSSARWVRGRWRYEQWPGGHWIPLEQPARLSKAVLEFLA